MAAKVRTAHTSLAELRRHPSVVAVEPALRGWVEESLAEAAHPIQGRAPTALAAVLAGRLARLPASERRRVASQFRRRSAPARSLSEHVGALSDIAGVADRLTPLTDRLEAKLRPAARPTPVRYEVLGVRCATTTREVGADELHTAAFVIGPAGEPTLLGPAHLGNFRVGDDVTFPVPLTSPPVTVADADGFQSFVAMSYTAEVDNGEFFGFVVDAYQALLADGALTVILESSEVRRIERGMWALAVPAAVVGALAYPPAGIPVLAAVIAGLVAEIIRIRRADEFFTVQIETLELLVDADNPPPAQTTSTSRQHLTGYGASYFISTRWRIG